LGWRGVGPVGSMHSTAQTGITALLDRNKQNSGWEITGVRVLCVLGSQPTRKREKQIYCPL